MTVKIVRGVIPQDSAAKTVLPNSATGNATVLARSAGAANASQGEAASTALRSTRVSAPERVRDPEKAARLADSLADAVRKGGSEEDHSYLNSSSAKPHFVN